MFACPKRHSIAHYVQLGPAYYHFHRNQRYGTHKAYRLIDNSPSVITKIPEKEREGERERFILVPSIFLSVLCTWNTRFNFLSNILFDWGFLKGFFLFDGSRGFRRKLVLYFFVFYSLNFSLHVRGFLGGKSNWRRN